MFFGHHIFLNLDSTTSQWTVITWCFWAAASCSQSWLIYLMLLFNPIIVYICRRDSFEGAMATVFVEKQSEADLLSQDLALLGLRPGKVITVSLLRGQWEGIVSRMGVNQRREHKAAYDRWQGLSVRTTSCFQVFGKDCGSGRRTTEATGVWEQWGLPQLSHDKNGQVMLFMIWFSDLRHYINCEEFATNYFFLPAVWAPGTRSVEPVVGRRTTKILFWKDAWLENSGHPQKNYLLLIVN